MVVTILNNFNFNQVIKQQRETEREREGGGKEKIHTTIFEILFLLCSAQLFLLLLCACAFFIHFFMSSTLYEAFNFIGTSNPAH